MKKFRGTKSRSFGAQARFGGLERLRLWIAALEALFKSQKIGFEKPPQLLKRNALKASVARILLFTTFSVEAAKAVQN